MRYILLFVILNFQLSIFAQDYINLYHKGLVSFESADYETAVEFFSKVIEQNPRYTNAYINRGLSYMEQQEFSKAVEDFNQANKLRKDIASYYLAQVYAMMNNPEKTVEHLIIHLNSRYKLPESKIRLDKKFDNVQYSESWKDLWKEDWYSKKDLIHEEIRYLNSDEKYFESLDLLDKQLKKYKKDHEMYALKAETYFALNNPKASVINYDKAIKLNKRIPEYFINRGKAYLELKKEKDALLDFDRALEMSDDNIELYLLKAEVLNGMGKYDQAIDQLKNYLNLIPEDHKALYLSGVIFSNNKQYSKSIESFTKLINLDPSNVSYFISRADSYFKNTQYQKAYEDYSMALDLDPRNPMVYLERGNARLRIGQYEGACYDWGKADEMGSLEAKKNIIQFCK